MECCPLHIPIGVARNDRSVESRIGHLEMLIKGSDILPMIKRKSGITGSAIHSP